MGVSLATSESNRRLILDAARALVLEKGFSGTTLDEVLESAHITKGKFFHYFSSKDELFEELLREALNSGDYPEYKVLLKNCIAKSAFEKLLFILDHALHFHKRGAPSVIRLCLAATFFFSKQSPELTKLRKKIEANARVLEKLIEQSIKEGSFSENLSPSVLSMFPVSLGIGGNVTAMLGEKNHQSYKLILEFKNVLISLRKSST